MGDRRGAYRVLLVEPKGMKHRWDNDIKMDLGELGVGK
jgi:hypothetical protein